MQVFSADDNATIAYRDEGRGQPLLCLAGLTRTAADFDDLAAQLTGVRLIRMDYRGRGASDWTGAASYTVPREARDALQLLDHLGIARAPVLGTSRGGLVGMVMAATAPDRVAGLCFNDVGPVIARPGLERIFDYIGRNPTARTHVEAAAAMARTLPGFANVPESRWLDEARRQYTAGPDGLRINYDPALRQAFLEAFEGPEPDLWPLFEALAGKPVALIHGAGSDLLTADMAAEMRRRRPDLIYALVPDRGHIPFLDEPESLAAIRAFLAATA